jgi:hypothetical protein
MGGGGGCKSIRTERSSKTRDWTQTKQMETDCGERRFERDKETREEDEDEGKKEEGRSSVWIEVHQAGIGCLLYPARAKLRQQVKQRGRRRLAQSGLTVAHLHLTPALSHSAHLFQRPVLRFTKSNGVTYFNTRTCYEMKDDQIRPPA